MQTLDHLNSTMICDDVVGLALDLASVLPPSLSHAMFLSTGAEANEAAIKMAKLYTGKYEVVAFSGSWREYASCLPSRRLMADGMTLGAAAATFSAGRRGYGPTAVGQLVLPTPYAYRSPFVTADGQHDWRTELEFGWDMIDRE